MVSKLSATLTAHSVQFKDSLDFAVGESLAFTETISAAVDKTPDEVVTSELLRMNTSTMGNEQEMTPSTEDMHANRELSFTGQITKHICQF